MAKGNKTQTVTTQPDQVSDYYRRGTYEQGMKALGGSGYYAAEAARNNPRRKGESYDQWRARVNATLTPGMAPILSEEEMAAKMANFAPGQASEDALSFYGGLLGEGGYANRGLAALGGDASALDALMDPQVGYLGDRAASQIGDAATRAGAFGGARHGIAEGEARSGIMRDAYANAIARAGQLAGFGFGAAQMAPGLEQQLQLMRDPDMRRALLQKMLMGGMPVGSTNSQPVNHDPMAGTKTGLGVGSQFGPWGALIGGGIGLGWDWGSR